MMYMCFVVCLSFFFFCLFACYHSRAVYVEGAPDIEGALCLFVCLSFVYLFVITHVLYM